MTFTECYRAATGPPGWSGVHHRRLDWLVVSLTLGIVGLPNVGKSTLFNALTRNDALAANYPFATIEPNVGVVPLPDPRLDRLAAMFSSARGVPATVSFVDIAGLEKEARVRKEARPALEAASAARAVLDSGRTLFGSPVTGLAELSLLTSKPFLYVF